MTYIVSSGALNSTHSLSAESVNDESPFQEPMMEVEEEFAPTSRPTLRFTEPELADQTQVPRKGRVATHVTQTLCQSAVRERLAKCVKYKASSFLFLFLFFPGLAY